jgi:hypothetical protein
MLRQSAVCVAVLLVGVGLGRLPEGLSSEPAAAMPQPPCPCVRPLTLPAHVFPGGQFDSPVIRSRADLEKAVGPQVAAHLAQQVDFDKQSIVAMQYETGGPPFGKPKYQIEFYVHGPTIGPGEARGMALKLGLDFFAVPRDVPVVIGKPRE